MDENTLSGHQFQLFEPPSQTAPERNYDPESWSSQPDISWHASAKSTMPPSEMSAMDRFNSQDIMTDDKPAYGEGFHTGTRKSAGDRAKSTDRTSIHPVRHEGSMALRPESMGAPWALTGGQLGGESGDDRDPRQVWSDLATNSSQEATRDLRAGMTIPYLNEMEDQGSISFRSPRQNLRSWSEDVTADPGASRHDKLVAEQYDLTETVKPPVDPVAQEMSGGAPARPPIHTQEPLMRSTPEGDRIYDKSVMDQPPDTTGLGFRKKR